MEELRNTEGRKTFHLKDEQKLESAACGPVSSKVKPTFLALLTKKLETAKKTYFYVFLHYLKP